MKKIISLLMVLFVLASVVTSVDVSAFASFTPPEGRLVVSVKEYELAPGIVEKYIVTNNYEGTHQAKAYVAVADFNNPDVGFLAGYRDYDSSGTWGMQTVRDQARKASEAKGVSVVAGINADYYCMQNGNPVGMTQGEPYGALIMDGKVVHNPEGQPHYFAVLNDDTPVIRDSTESWSDVKYAIGAPMRIVMNGEVAPNPDETRMPRCAIGITADNKVIIYSADGRQAPESEGETVRYTAEMMKALGCVEAVYLDGGGSATFASQRTDEKNMTVKSNPSDGTERKVSTTALLYYAGTINRNPQPQTHTHTWKDATCTAPQICSTCGETVGTATGHKEVDVEGKNATCTETGLTDGKKCSVCGLVTVEQKETSVLGHSEMTLSAKSPTCDVPGLTEGKQCVRCGNVSVKQNEIPALGHTIITYDAVEATCTETGLTEGKECVTCGKVLVKQEIVTVSHEEEVIAGKEPTCTSSGLTEGKKCKLCNEITVSQTVIPALGHKEEIIEGKTATCDTDGITDGKKCTVCGKVTVKQLEVPAYGHEEKVLPKIQATYTETGLTEGKKCIVCGKVTVKQKKINKKKLKKVTVSSVKSTKKKTAAVSWKKTTDATGYVIEYSTSKKFTKKTTKSVTVKKGKTVKATLKNLTSKKKYYVRVKACRTEGKKTAYGSYSSVKTVKVK